MRGGVCRLSREFLYAGSTAGKGGRLVFFLETGGALATIGIAITTGRNMFDLEKRDLWQEEFDMKGSTF
jgi:hypothetical protein